MTPALAQRIAAKYAQCANANETARDCGVSEKTVRRVIAAKGAPKRAVLNARAAARGLRIGRRELLKGVALVTRYFAEHCGEGLGLEPGDVARLITAQGAAVARLIDLDAHTLERKKARLTRDKTRAETALLLARADGRIPEQAVITIDDARAAVKEIFGSPSALTAKTDHHERESTQSADAVGGVAAPVSAALDR